MAEALRIGKIWDVRYRVSAGTPATLAEKIIYVCAEDVPTVCEKVNASDIGQSNTFKGIKSVVEYQGSILF